VHLDTAYTSGAGGFLVVLALGAAAQTIPDRSALRIPQSNLRCFTDNTGRAIYPTGTHDWNNLQDTGHFSTARTGGHNDAR
jgi:hypothetical protein